MNTVQALAQTKDVEHSLFGREVTTYIEVPPVTVFRYIADIRRHVEWSTEPLNITVEPGPEHGQGASYTSTARVGSGKISARICVIAEEPPVRFVYECKDLFGHYRWSMILQPQGNGTVLTQRMERLQGPLWVRLVQPHIMWPLVGRRSVGKGLSAIKARLETGTRQA